MDARDFYWWHTTGQSNKAACVSLGTECIVTHHVPRWIMAQAIVSIENTVKVTCNNKCLPFNLLCVGDLSCCLSVYTLGYTLDKQANVVNAQ